MAVRDVPNIDSSPRRSPTYSVLREPSEHAYITLYVHTSTPEVPFTVHRPAYSP